MKSRQAQSELFPKQTAKGKSLHKRQYSLCILVHNIRDKIDAYGRYLIDGRTEVGGYILDAEC